MLHKMTPPNHWSSCGRCDKKIINERDAAKITVLRRLHSFKRNTELCENCFNSIIAFLTPNLLSDNIIKLGLGIRARNCLINSNIETIGDLIKMNDEEIRKIINLGSKSAEEIIDARNRCKIYNSSRIAQE